MDARDKFSGSFKAMDGMSGKMDKGKTPAPRGNNGQVDASTPIMPKRSSYGTTPTSNMGKKGLMSNMGLGGATRKTMNQIRKGST